MAAKRTVLAALVLPLVWLLPSQSSAQTDAQLWMSASANFRISKPLRASVTGHLRFDDDISRVAATMPEAELQYRLLPWLRLQSAYRLERKRDSNGEFENRHRLNFDARGIFDLDTVRFEYRGRYQVSVRPNKNVHTLRNRFTGAYRELGRFGPYAELEVFHRLADAEAIQLQKYRFTIGSSIAIDDHELEVFYRIELPQDNPDDPTNHIVGIGYGYDVN